MNIWKSYDILLIKTWFFPDLDFSNERSNPFHTKSVKKFFFEIMVLSTDKMKTKWESRFFSKKF